ncbi:hypothetical protein ACIQ34_01410 [Ureibacillus sp. NPDC094379]
MKKGLHIGDEDPNRRNHYEKGLHEGDEDPIGKVIKKKVFMQTMKTQKGNTIIRKGLHPISEDQIRNSIK